ncbi:MAG TPA: hypothetical protein VFZ59_06920 [Verrucomicrobiae bacterium]|nr:hypothetical protein [Verrucomicrobiae bacterium]
MLSARAQQSNHGKALDKMMFRILTTLFAVSLVGVHAWAAPVISTRAVSSLPPELGGISGSGESSSPLISGDARFVVFTSGADNLVTNDRNGALDVFVYDPQSQALTLVSSNHDGTGSAHASSVALDLSSNGRWLLFQSRATDLMPGDTNAVTKLFLKDLATGSMILVSATSDGGPSVSGLFNNASLSQDGRYIVFDSPGKDLHPADTNSLLDVFVRDVVSGSNHLISARLDGLAGGSSNSEKPVMSGDGRWIAFQSISSNLASNDVTTTLDVFLRDRQDNTTTLVSVNPVGTGGGNSASSKPSISDDGRYVTFESLANNLATNGAPASQKYGIYLRDLGNGITRFVSSLTDDGNGNRPVISADGRFVVYESQTNLYCMEIVSGTVFLMTTNRFGTGGGNGVSFNPRFTPDGQHCVFLSFATNLTEHPAAFGPSRVLVRDMETGSISLISTNRQGSATDLESLAPAISDDGAVVVFQSYDPNLVENDLNGSSDVFLRRAANGVTELLSRRATAAPPVTAMGRSAVVTSPVSADGRFVLFASTARHLTGDDTKSLENLFVRDLWSGSNQMVSVNLDGSAAGNGFNSTPSLSGDGRWAVFQHASATIAAGDTNAFADIFMRDLWHGTNLLVSRAWNGGGANGFSVNPRVSSNGQFVVFQSVARNIAPLDSNFSIDVFVRDLLAQTNIAISVNPLTGQCVGAQASSGTTDETPYPPLITPDGSWVVLWSTVNLTTNAAPVGSPGLYAKHVQTGQSLVLGIPTNGVIRAGNNTATLSPGGRFVAFTTTNNFVGVFDFVTQTNAFVLNYGKDPTLSADGRWLAFESRATNWGITPGNNVSDVFVLDRQSNAVRLVSSSLLGTASGNGPSTTPLISGDGRFVVFQSKASDLVATDTNEQWDVFVRDLQTETTFALLATTNGATGNRLSQNPVLSSDGRTVALESFASDVVAGDFNQFRDVFVVRLSAGDSDADGMEDDWEVAHFGNLSRDGTDDADNDGASDKSEFIAGTSPVDQLSVLRVITLNALTDGSTTLLWSSVPGKTYRVQFKDDLASTVWNTIDADVFAIGSTASAIDPGPNPAGKRFYRVLVLN